MVTTSPGKDDGWGIPFMKRSYRMLDPLFKDKGRLRTVCRSAEDNDAIGFFRVVKITESPDSDSGECAPDQ